MPSQIVKAFFFTDGLIYFSTKPIINIKAPESSGALIYSAISEILVSTYFTFCFCYNFLFDITRSWCVVAKLHY